jgi:hypothetical protein
MLDAVADAPGCSAAAPTIVEGPSAEPGSGVSLSLTAISHDSGGVVCQRTSGTGDDQLLSINVPASGMVTLIVSASDNPEPSLVTWTDVQPGEHLVFPSPILRGVTTKSVPFSLTVPVLTGATRYDVTVMCEIAGVRTIANAAPGPLSGTAACPSSSTALTAAVRATLSSSVSFATGDTAPIAATGQTAVTIGAWTSAASVDATITGAAVFDRAAILIGPAPMPGAFGTTYATSVGAGGAAASTGSVTTIAQWGGVELVQLASMTATAAQQTLDVSRSYSSPSSISLDVSGDFLPLVTASLAQPLPRPYVSWSTPAGAVIADMFVAKVGSWYLIAPAREGTVEYPDLPSDLRPTSNATLVGACVCAVSGSPGYETTHLDPYGAVLATDSRSSCLGDPLVASFE